MTKVAILASGSGTTAEALLQKVRDGLIDIDPVMIIHNNPSAGVVEQPTVKELNVKTTCINTKIYPRDGDGTEPGSISNAESQAIVDALEAAEVELVLLLGYMKRVRGALLDQYGFVPGKHKVATDAKMLNVHPGPLPQTTGLYGSGVHEHVLELYRRGEISETGPTLHTVSEQYDEGPIVKFFAEVKIDNDDEAEDIERRVRQVERDKLYLGIAEFLKQ